MADEADGSAAPGTPETTEKPDRPDLGRAPAEKGGDGAGPEGAARRRLLALIGRWTTTAGAFDTAVCLVYLCVGLWLSRGLWPDPNNRAIADNVNDQTLIEWFLAHGVLVWKGDFSLVTDRLNAPDGVNLMSNASHILHGVLMAPVTVLFGPGVSFALLVALNLAGTAAGWYLLFARELKLHRGAAMVGGIFTGFAPGMIAQSNSHLHMTAQWLVPPIVWCVLRLTRARTPRQVLLTSLGLSALICAQLMLGEEVLYLTAVTLTLFGLVYAAIRWRWAMEIGPRFVTGAVLAIGVSVLAVTYPLWVQVSGPQHTPNAPFAPRFFYADVATYWLFSPLSIAGSPEAGKLATSSAEYNSYFGLPLLLVLAACVLWRWRSPVVVAATGTSVIMAALSFGPDVYVNGEKTDWPAIYRNLSEIPLINGALPTRYALALIPLFGLLIAVCLDAAARTGGIVRIAVPIAVLAALVPVWPRPLATVERPPVPQFITTGAWRQCAPEGGVIVPVPLPTPGAPDAMRWPAAANVGFAIPEGFFIGPYGPGGRSSIGTYKQSTSSLLDEVAKSGTVPPITDAQRAEARYDLAFWRADCVALTHVPHEAALRTTLEQLIGPGTPIADVWTWKINK